MQERDEGFCLMQLEALDGTQWQEFPGCFCSLFPVYCRDLSLVTTIQ